MQHGNTSEVAGQPPLRRDDAGLPGRIDDALDGLRADGTLARLGRQWLGTGEPGTTTSVV